MIRARTINITRKNKVWVMARGRAHVGAFRSHRSDQVLLNELRNSWKEKGQLNPLFPVLDTGNWGFRRGSSLRLFTAGSGRQVFFHREFRGASYTRLDGNRL